MYQLIVYNLHIFYQHESFFTQKLIKEDKKPFDYALARYLSVFLQLLLSSNINNIHILF
jgi:hypothetical protein